MTRAYRCRSNPLLLELHVQPQAADFIGQHVEASGRAGLQRVFPFHHALVNLGTPLDVVGLDSEKLLKDVGGSVGLERPYKW